VTEDLSCADNTFGVMNFEVANEVGRTESGQCVGL
jgi:hypothetical protein